MAWKSSSNSSEEAEVAGRGASTAVPRSVRRKVRAEDVGDIGGDRRFFRGIAEGVGREYFVGDGFDPLKGVPKEEAMGAGGADRAGPVLLQQLGRLDDRSARGDDVVYEDNVLPFEGDGEVDRDLEFDMLAVDPFLVEGEPRLVEEGRHAPDALDAPFVGGDQHVEGPLAEEPGDRGDAARLVGRLRELREGLGGV